MHNRVGIMHNYYSISRKRRADQSRDSLICLKPSIVSGTQIYIITLYLDPRPGEEEYIPQASGIAPETARTLIRILSQLIVLGRNGRYSRYRSMLISIFADLLRQCQSDMMRVLIRTTTDI